MVAHLKRAFARNILSKIRKEALFDTRAASRPNCHLVIGTQAVLPSAAASIIAHENDPNLGAFIVSDELLRRRHPFDNELRINIGGAAKEAVLLADTDIESGHLVSNIDNETRFEYVNPDLEEWRNSLIGTAVAHSRDLFVISDLSDARTSDLSSVKQNTLQYLAEQLKGHDLHVHQIMTNPIWDAVRLSEAELLIRKNNMDVGWHSSNALTDVSIAPQLELLSQNANLASFSIHRPDRLYAQQYSIAELRAQGTLLSASLNYQSAMNAAIVNYSAEGLGYLQRLDQQLKPYYEAAPDQFLPTADGRTTAQAAIDAAQNNDLLADAYAGLQQTVSNMPFSD